MRAALREDPDVIVIGELRDNETVSLALTAAETGHIVLGTLNSTSAPKAIDRIMASASRSTSSRQVRASLSESLKYVIAQRLLPAQGAAQAGGRLSRCCAAPSAIANMIRDEKTFQIPSAMQIGRSLGMQTFDDALKALVTAGKVSGETAYRAAAKKEDFEAFLPGGAPAARRAHGTRGEEAMSSAGSASASEDRPLPAPDDEPRRLRLPPHRRAPADAARVGLDGADPLPRRSRRPTSPS